MSVDMLQVAIGDTEILIRSSQIREVVRPMPLTPVPMGPGHILGLTNIHGQVVSVIDAGKISMLPELRSNEGVRTRYLVLRHPEINVAICVDEVRRLRKVDETELAAAQQQQNEPCFELQLDAMSCLVLDCGSLLH